MFKEYKEVKEQIKELEEKMRSIQESIIQDMDKRGVSKEETKYGAFTISARTVWSYSEAIKEAEEKLKIKKIKEQEKGIAKEKAGVSFLVFTRIKEIRI